MKKALCSLSLIVLAGCASLSEPVALPENVVINENKSIKSISFHENISPSFDKIDKCLALNIKNKNVGLSDSSNTYVGAYTGNIYNSGNSYTDFASKDKVYSNQKDKIVVVNGNTEYSKYLIDYVVRFRMLVQNKNNKTTILFDDINRAQLSTGYAVNDGFQPIYTHLGAHSDTAVNSLEIIKNEIVSCLSN